MTSYINKMTNDVILSPTCSLYHKCPVLKFFSIKFPIEWAIWELSTIIFKFFKKKKIWGRISGNRGAVREISTDFQSENGFELTTYRRKIFPTINGTIRNLIRSHYVTPHPTFSCKQMMSLNSIYSALYGLDIFIR